MHYYNFNAETRFICRNITCKCAVSPLCVSICSYYQPGLYFLPTFSAFKFSPILSFSHCNEIPPELDTKCHKSKWNWGRVNGVHMKLIKRRTACNEKVVQWNGWIIKKWWSLVHPHFLFVVMTCSLSSSVRPGLFIQHDFANYFLDN